MSSENTARKFKLGQYLDYVASLPTIDAVRHGATMTGREGRTLFD
jgi:hypothetical protein